MLHTEVRLAGVSFLRVENAPCSESKHDLHNFHPGRFAGQVSRHALNLTRATCSTSLPRSW